MTATQLALVFSILIVPWLTEILKRFAVADKYAFLTSMIVSFLLAILASVVSGEMLLWSDPIGFTKNVSLIFAVATIVYRSLGRGKPEVLKRLRGQE